MKLGIAVHPYMSIVKDTFVTRYLSIDHLTDSCIAAGLLATRICWRLESKIMQLRLLLQGRPVLVVFASRHHMRNRSLDETIRLIIYTLDNSAALANTSINPLGQMLCLFDLSGVIRSFHWPFCSEVQGEAHNTRRVCFQMQKAMAATPPMRGILETSGRDTLKYPPCISCHHGHHNALQASGQDSGSKHECHCLAPGIRGEGLLVAEGSAIHVAWRDVCL